MTQKLILLAITSAFAVTSGVAFAQNPNDGPKYPNMESHKQFKASATRITIIRPRAIP
jgi:hypothetical protein